MKDMSHVPKKCMMVLPNKNRLGDLGGHLERILTSRVAPAYQIWPMMTAVHTAYTTFDWHHPLKFKDAAANLNAHWSLGSSSLRVASFSSANKPYMTFSSPAGRVPAATFRFTTPWTFKAT